MAGPIQTFIDSGAGIVVASTLHTVGAIAMLASLAGYISWTRHLRAGRHQVGVLQGSAVLGYLAVFANLVGGFMRTYQSDHPDLTLLGENAWVQVLVVKHIILFVSMGALVYLFEGVAPRLLRKGQRNWRGHGWASWTVGIGILVASVMGAAMQVTPLGNEDGAMPPPEADAARSYQFSGQLTSNPVAPSVQEGTFDVPAGADRLQVALSWTPRQLALSLTLTSPVGDATQADVATGRATAAVDAPAPGRWSYTVGAQVAVQAEWTLAVIVEDADRAVFEETLFLQPGSFYEINTVMAEGATISWDWESAEPVHFDLHTHFDGQTEYLEDMTTDAHAGNHTAHREGGYSLLWSVEGTTPVELTFRVEGQYTLHSTVGP